MPSTTTIALVGAGVVVALIVGYFLFAPKGSTRVDEALGQEAAAATALSSGGFEGADRFHKVSGTVTVYEADNGTFLRFEDYEATSGPDVFFYVSTSENATFDEGERTKVPVPGGAGNGQATLRGNFNVPLPEGVDPATIKSIIVWCDRFSVKFGSATLS